MSWNDPCSKCGEPRRDCECRYIPLPPLTQEQIEERRLKQIENERICAEKGHDWMCPIVCFCTRCGISDSY